MKNQYEQARWWLAANATHFVAERREPSGAIRGKLREKPGGLRRTATSFVAEVSGTGLAATLIMLMAGCAGWPHSNPSAVSPAWSESPAPVNQAAKVAPVDVELGDGQAVIRGQNPSPPTGNYQSVPGSDNYYRRPMVPSGSIPAAPPQQGPAFNPNVNNRYAAAQPGGSGDIGFLPPPTGGPPIETSPYVPSVPYAQDNYAPGGYGPGGYGPQSPPLTLPSLGPMPSSIADIDVLTEEAQTGRFMFGVGVNSDAGLVGNIVIDERNFDMFRYPTTWRDFYEGRAFRGGGQGFRAEAVPGTQVQRYTVSLTEPYLLGTQVSFNASAYYFDRIFFDWDERRAGGRFGLGYRLTPDTSISATMRAERVTIADPRVIGVPELDAAVGKHDLFSGKVTLAHDTRDVPFAPTEGHLVEVSYEHAFGSFDFPRVDINCRQYYMLHERADGSGRHVLGYSMRAGFTGSQTPVFENYFAGGYSTIRGFDFRGASPKSIGDVIVGGQFLFLGSVEYLFPLTADDMLKGVIFCDFGTVEESINIDPEDYRVAPGFGLRVNVPAMGPAPIALDFAFALAEENTDTKQVFSFFIGFGR